MYVWFSFWERLRARAPHNSQMRGLGRAANLPHNAVFWEAAAPNYATIGFDRMCEDCKKINMQIRCRKQPRCISTRPRLVLKGRGGRKIRFRDPGPETLNPKPCFRFRGRSPELGSGPVGFVSEIYTF